MPFGVLLSGGLDSSLVASVIARLRRKKFLESGNPADLQPLKSFSIGLDGSPDLVAAQKVLTYLLTCLLTYLLAYLLTCWTARLTSPHHAPMHAPCTHACTMHPCMHPCMRSVHSLVHALFGVGYMVQVCRTPSAL